MICYHNMSKRFTLILFALFLSVSFILFIGCEGQTGPQGEQGVTGEDGDDGEDGPEGLVGPQGPVYWQGDYDGETTYTQGDAVYYLGSSYICMTQTQGNLPTNDTYWDIIALAGEMAVWTGGDVTGMANFLSGADFAAGTNVDFTDATVSGLASWNGGDVSGLTNFLGGVNFAAGTTVDFTEATISGLESWNGGYVDNRATFMDAIVCHDTLYAANPILFTNYADQVRWIDGIGGVRKLSIDGNSLGYRTGAEDEPTITLENNINGGRIYLASPTYSNNGIEMKAIMSRGDAEIRLHSNSIDDAIALVTDEDNGGCGIIRLKNSSGVISIELNGCTGLVTMMNSLGKVTIELYTAS